MTQPEETPVSFIPSNFIEKGKILNGTFDIRNAIESIVLSLAIGIPVFHLPLSLTARIIILCMTALPAAMVALIGIGGESITLSKLVGWESVDLSWDTLGALTLESAAGATVQLLVEAVR